MSDPLLKYNVTIPFKAYAFIEVRAKNPEDAKRIAALDIQRAEDIYPYDIQADPEGEWEVNVGNDLEWF